MTQGGRINWQETDIRINNEICLGVQLLFQLLRNVKSMTAVIYRERSMTMHEGDHQETSNSSDGVINLSEPDWKDNRRFTSHSLTRHRREPRGNHCYKMPYEISAWKKACRRL